MTTPDLDMIAAAIRANRGGWPPLTPDNAHAFRTLWDSLDDATRAAYLASVQPADDGDSA